MQRPELAGFVKAISFETWDFLGKDRYSPMPQGMQPPTSAAYAAALAFADLPDQVNKAILRQLCDEIPAGHLSLLLALCTKLRVLMIPSDCGSFSRLITRNLLWESEDGLQVTLPPRSVSLTESSLQCLRELNNVNSLQNESAAQELLPLLCLSSLQVLHIHSLRDPETRTGHTVPDPPSSYLNHNPISLEFDFCMLSVAGLSRILGACENSISLTVRWHPGSYNDHLIQ